MKKIENIAYGNGHKRQVLDLYLPDTDCFKAFVYFHGGGMEGGSKEEYIALGEYLANNGIAAAIINYRLYPDAKYPEFIEDAAAAVAWVFENIGKYGSCKGIYAGGSSAGGYMSMMLCFDKKWLGAQGIEPMQLAGFFHDAGQPTAHFNVLREKGIDSKRVIIDETAPLYHVGIDEEYPSMQLVVSDNDMEGRPEQMQLLKATLDHFGHSGKVNLRIMHGTHCHYVHETDEKGIPSVAKMICEYVQK